MGYALYTFRLGVLACCVFLAGCWSKESEIPVSLTGKKLAVVNVLGEKEHQDAHIKGSINVPLTQLNEIAQSWPKNIRLVVYCANYQCTASSLAARQLAKMGFSDVVAYEGGTAEWYSKKYPLEGPSKESYLTKPGQAHSPAADIKVIDAEALKWEIEKADKAGLLIKSKNMAA